MKVLLFCPTKRFEPETKEAILKMEFDCPTDYFLTRDNPHEDGRENILHNYRKGRRVFLEGDYTDLMVVESDIIPPADAFLKLATLDTDMALGLYMFRRGRPVVNALRYIPGHKQPSQSLSFFPEELKRAWGQVTRVSGAGLGCALISREVMEVVEFRQGGAAHCDWYFVEDILKKGFEIWCDLSVLCGHKTPEGNILWPQEEVEL